MTEAVRVHRGDPILSFDGKSIVARWAVDMEMEPGANSFSWTWHGRVEAPPRMFDGSNGKRPVNQAVIRLRWQSGPIRVWQVMGIYGDDQELAFKAKWFLPPEVDPGPSDAGIVAACDVLLGLKLIYDPAFEARLHQLKSRSVDRIEHQRRKETA